MSHFSIDGNIGILQPYTRGLHLHIPHWVALLIAVPLLLVSAFAATVPNAVTLQLLFGVPGGLFLALWALGWGVSKKRGLVRIDKRAFQATLIGRDGSERAVEFGRFLSIQIERLVTPRGYLWRGVLSGRDGNLVLVSGFYFQRTAVDWLTPVASWLAIPVTVSEVAIDGVKWALTPDREANPYP